MNFITTMVGFGISVTFILLVFTKLICRKIHSIGSRSVSETQTISERERPINGLEEIVVAALPTTEFNNEAFSSRQGAQCSICLGEYKDKEKLRTLPTCGHSFHLTCIDKWFHRQSTCPICRLSLHDSVEGKRIISPTFNMVLQTADGSEVVRDHSDHRLCSCVSSSSSENNQEHQGSVPRNLVAGEAETGDN